MLFAVAFPRYFVEQGFVELALWCVSAAAVYGGVFTGVAAAAARVAGRRMPSSAAVGVLAGLAIFAAGVTLFEALALYYRYVPPGSGAQRAGPSLDVFYSASRVGFGVLYALVVGGSAAVAALLARRRRTRPLRPALGAASAVLLFLAITFPAVEFENACNVGRALLVDDLGRC